MPLMDLAKKMMRRGEPGDACGVQYGAVPYRIVDGQPVFLMVTSRRSANWVFPKGSPIKGLSPQETAAQEAFEEAGIRGQVGDTVIGTYLHPKNSNEEKLVEVQLFPMLVTEQVDDWPEEAERFRHWALLPEVKKLMACKPAAKAAADFCKLLGARQQPHQNEEHTRNEG